MKPMNFSKKLILNKKTIANLENVDMLRLRGGKPDTLLTVLESCTVPCPIPNTSRYIYCNTCLELSCGCEL